VVAAYLAEIGETRRIGQLERALASSLGTTIADAVVDKILTPANLVVLLKSGRVQTMPTPLLPATSRRWPRSAG